jgi:hypothetical protein
MQKNLVNGILLSWARWLTIMIRISGHLGHQVWPSGRNVDHPGHDVWPSWIICLPILGMICSSWSQCQPILATMSDHLGHNAWLSHYIPDIVFFSWLTWKFQDRSKKNLMRRVFFHFILFLLFVKLLKWRYIYIYIYCKILVFALQDNLFSPFLLFLWAGFHEFRSVDIFFKSLTISELWRH